MGAGDGGVLVFVGMVVVMMMAGIELKMVRGDGGSEDVGMVGNDVEVYTFLSSSWKWCGHAWTTFQGRCE